jgi:uncharacterized protein YyaL (SSP411 family)
MAAYGVSERGNFEGKNILRQSDPDAKLADHFHLHVDTIAAKLTSLRVRMLERRSQRVRPNTDDKVLVAWNALTLIAFAEAGRALGKQKYTEAAIKNGDFILENMLKDGKLLRSWRAGVARHAAYLEDYAGLALALLALYQANLNPKWYQAAVGLIEQMLAHFGDRQEPSSAFFDTRDDQEALLYRPKDLQDNATPSGNALAVMALLQLAAFEGRADWRELAEGMLSSNLSMLIRYPSAFAQWLCAADFALGPVNEVAILGDPADRVTQSLLRPLWTGYHPRLVLAVSPFPPPAGSPALLNDRRLLNGRPTVYVCQGFVCQQPVNDPEQMLAQLT